MSSVAKPPQAERIETVTEIHGEKLVDHYAWLKEKTSDKVINHLKAENAFAKTILDQCQPLADELLKEYRARLQETDETAPFKKGDYVYYERTEEGKQYKIYCRKPIDGGEEQVMLDLNVEHTEHDYRMLELLKVSPNQQILAYTVDFTGNESFTAYFKDLTTGKLLEKQIEHTKSSLEWGDDSTTIFYDRFDETLRPHQVWRTSLDVSDAADDELLLSEDDAKYELTFVKSNSERFIVISARSGCDASHWALDVRQAATAKPEAVVERQANAPQLTSVEHWCGNDATRATAPDGLWFILSNRRNQTNFALYSAPVGKLVHPVDWHTVLLYDEKHYLQSMVAFQTHLVVFERSHALRRVVLVDLMTEQWPSVSKVYVEFDEPVHTVMPLPQQTYEGPLRFRYSSLVVPDTDYELDFATNEKRVVKQLPVPNYDQTQYETERLWATAKDNARIPISLVRKKGVQTPSKLHLYGYGSYGICKDPRFDSKVFSMLDRGWQYAIAHVRGSATMGATWFEAGRFEHKMNTFTDFIACAEHLVAEQRTKHELMSIEGRSAGGLLVGAVLNLRPDVCRVALNDVGFVDVVNTMLDDSIPLTVLEYEQWGNPNERKYFDAMKSYSPYENIRADGDYPHMLLRAGLNDPRVQYYEPAKYVQKLRHLNPNATRVFALEVQMGAGHFGSSGRFSHLAEAAQEFAFCMTFVDK